MKTVKSLSTFKRYKWKGIHRVGKFVSTMLARLIYGDFLKVSKGASVGYGFVAKQFTDKENILCVKLGRASRFGRNILVQGQGTFSLGENSFIGDGCVIGVNDSIKIARNVMIGNYCTFRDTDHVSDGLDVPMMVQGVVSDPIFIGEDVWIGHGVIVLKGVTIGRGSIVAAGALVRESVGPFSVVGGVPARLLKTRDGVSNEK